MRNRQKQLSKNVLRRRNATSMSSMNDSFFKNEEYEGGALEAVGGDLDGSKRILQGGKKRKAYWVLVSSFHFDKNKVPKIEVSFAQEV